MSVGCDYNRATLFPVASRKSFMTDLSSFAITQKWPAQHPDRLQLYSLPTPNGVKVSILLEELGLPYEPHLVSFATNDQLTPQFMSLNPNNKIPAIIDPDGPGGQPLPLFESGAILIYLAEKTGRFISADPATRYETLQWLMFQMGGIGPMFGQLGFFNKFAGKDYEDKRPRDRYVAESKRLLGVLNQRLESRRWIMGDDYSIADIATVPVDPQPDRLLRGWRPGRYPGLPSHHPGAGSVPRSPGGDQGVDHSGVSRLFESAQAFGEQRQQLFAGGFELEIQQVIGAGLAQVDGDQRLAAFGHALAQAKG